MRKDKTPVVPSGIISAAVSLLKPYFPAITEENLSCALAGGSTSENGDAQNDGKPLTRRQAAERLSLSMRKIDYMVKNGELKSCRIGTSVRIDPASVRALLVYKSAQGVRA